MSNEIFYDLLKKLRITVSDEQIPFESGVRINVILECYKERIKGLKIKGLKNGDWIPISSDFVDIKKSDLEI